MRLLTIFLFASSLTVSANSFSQHVSLSAKGISLKQLFQAVEKQTGFVFFYNKQLLEDTKPVSIAADNMPLGQFLEAALRDQPLSFRIEGKTITLSRKIVEPPLLKLTSKLFTPADTIRQIRGVVTSDENEPIPAVTVMVKGTKRGASTDAKGAFTITADAGQVLVFTAIGYEETEVRIKNSDRLFVKMAQAVSSMQDHVVTGIYQRKKESFTGSSSTFTAKELKMVGNQNAIMALRTLDPSFAVVENSIFGSDPNRLPDIEIRGKSSVIGLTEQYGTNPNQPLFILDGFESSLAVISDLSMDRIESITLLKDAAATAIYGSKAANGVVVVETKRPTPGRLRLEYNNTTIVSWPDLSDYNLMNAPEKLEFEKLSGWLGTIDANGNFVTDQGDLKYNTRLAEVKRGVNSYWLNEPLRIGINLRHTVIAEGGDANFRYSTALTFGNNQGVMKGSDRKATSGNVKLMYRKGKLSVSNSLTIDEIKASREPVPFEAFVLTNPYHRKFNETGGINKVLESFSWIDLSSSTINKSETYFNPLFDFHNNNLDKSTSQGFTNNFEIEWRVLRELRARARVGLIQQSVKDEIFRSPFNSQFASVDPLLQGSYFESNERRMNYDGDFTLTYGKLLADKHMLNVVAGARFTQATNTGSSFEVRGFIGDEFPNAAFAFDYSDSRRAGYVESKRRTASYFLNTGYAFDERFLLDATVRADGASVFGSNRQFTTIWSMGLAWNVHNEKFFRDRAYDWVNSFRIRGSIGNPGNQNFSDYVSMRVYRYNNENRNPFGPSVIVNTHGNPSLKWQKTLDRNIGLDLITLKNRLRFNLDYFVKTTDPLLVFVNVPSSSGATLLTDNFGAQEQKGFTLVTSYALLQQKELSWMINVNARHLRSHYTNFGNALKNFNENNKGVNLTRYYDGASPSDLWAVRSLGIDPATGREIFLTKEGKQTFVHDYKDEVVVGNSDADLDGVIGTSFFYRGFSANISLRYRIGGQLFMKTLYDKVENIPYERIGLNQDRRALTDRWQKPGDNAKFKAISDSRYTPMSSRFVEDNNILAGESMSIGYETSKARWLKALRASSVTFRAYMNDVFRIATVMNERGIDYPFTGSVSFSVGVRF